MSVLRGRRPHGKGLIPQWLVDIYLGDLLGITANELDKQPAEWVDKMRLWYEQKAKAEEVRQKEQQRRSKRR